MADSITLVACSKRRSESWKHYYSYLYLNVEGYGDDSICTAQPKCLDEEKEFYEMNDDLNLYSIDAFDMQIQKFEESNGLFMEENWCFVDESN